MIVKGLKDILINSQKSCTTHTKLVKQLMNIYLKTEFEDFLQCFTSYLKYLLIHGEKEAVVERSLTFVSKFATSVKTENEENESKDKDVDKDEDDVDQLLVAVFNFLLKNHEANSKSVRYRVCYLINKLLNNMGEQASIDDDLYSTIYDTMLQRLMDKIPAIRVQAIWALARLQDPTNKECPVIKAYRYHLSMDPNSDVRKAVLNNIAITFQTLPDVLERIKDVKDLVRRQAYLVLAQKVHLRSFTIAQRVLLISEGLKDRSQNVRIIVKKNLLQAWLRLVDGKILDILSCLDVETSTESTQLALENMFADVPYSTLLENFGLLNKDRIIKFDDLKPESAFFWKCLAKHLKNDKADEYLDELLPDLTTFCDYIKDYVHMEIQNDIDPQETAVRLMQKEFVMQQLLSMTLLFDFSDEVGRKNLGLLTRNILLNTSIGESSIPTMCSLLKSLYPVNSRILNVAEIISDLREVKTEVQTEIVEPMQVQLSDEEQRKHKLKIAKISVQIFQLREELEECVRSLNLEKAQELKTKLKELEEKQELLAAEATRVPQNSVMNNLESLDAVDEEDKLSNEPEIIIRCLLILSQTLSHADVTTLSSTIRSLHDNLILPCLSSEVPDVRKNAIHALATICLLSLDLTKQHILLFIRISQIDIEEIQIIALKAVFDFLHLFGLEEFCSVAESISSVPGFTIGEPTPSGDLDGSHSIAMGNMIGNISTMLDSDSSEIRTIVAEGFCKLLLSSRLVSPKLFAHLLIMWFNPVTEDDQLLRHMLGVFFPLYAAGGADNADVICQAFIPVIQTIYKAPPRSPISDIDIDDVCDFLVSITNPRIVCSSSKTGSNVHDALVFSVCAEVISYPDRVYIRSLSQVMNKLSLTPNNYPTLKQIDALCDKMMKIVREKTVCFKIDRFQKSIKTLLKNAPLDVIKEEEMEDQVVPDESCTVIGETPRKLRRTLYNTDLTLELCEESSESEETIFTDTKNDTEVDFITAEIPLISLSLAPGKDGENASTDEISISESNKINLNSSNLKDAISESDSSTEVVKETPIKKKSRISNLKDVNSESDNNTEVVKETPIKKKSSISTRTSNTPHFLAKKVRSRSNTSDTSSDISSDSRKSSQVKKKIKCVDSDSSNSSSMKTRKQKVLDKQLSVSIRRLSTRSLNKTLHTLTSEPRLTRRSSSTTNSEKSLTSKSAEKKRKSSDPSSNGNLSYPRKSTRLSRSAKKQPRK